MTCRLIVCEKTNRWAAALRAALGHTRLPVVETRSLASCESAVFEASAAVVAIEITPVNWELSLDFVVRTGLEFPRTLVVALLSDETAIAERLLREAGAVDAINSVLDAPRIARLVRRHVAHAPPSEPSPQELAGQRLPWAAQA